MTPEGKVKAKLREGLDQLGAYHFAANTHGYGASGLPDDVACIDGLFFGFECKANEGDKPTMLQADNLLKITRAGGHAFLVDGMENVERTLTLIEGILGRKRDERRTQRNARKSRRGEARPRLRAD